ncbi:putative uncharacterized protein [Janthinobacterium agaricidamnosum NBRC 102515 = DSM 9628]|uniref:Uncharacterized protein n=1 Tax=Janthinobacterium agaricidamnosum NBRC 102515 = DSM 9628 TaxID=1349767 RepID=W0VFF7_9BURK|nr:hypothetical protein [Janthinobacterium agaricidamnosum]CDG86107.1 putative uncharacterized protein [Janthinobacterium agaricidamnosum NBRC 102515 = DSM 9628]
MEYVAKSALKGLTKGAIPFVKGLQATPPLPIALGMAVAEGMSDEAASESAEQALDAQGTNSATASPPPSDDDKDKDLSKEDRKSIRSLEKQIEKHEQKLADFKNNPSVRPGMEDQPKEVIEAQRATRIRHLETEIRTFQNNIDKIRGGQ